MTALAIVDRQDRTDTLSLKACKVPGLPVRSRASRQKVRKEPERVAHGLAALVGRYSEAMGVAVIVHDKKLGLSVVALHDLRNRVTELQKTLSEYLNVARRPIE